MTPQEREKLVDELKFTIGIGVARGFNYPYIAEQVIAIAKRAFAKDVEAAYREGWQIARSTLDDPNDWEIDWQDSNARATILASIPEKRETTRHLTTEKHSKPVKVRKTFVVKTVRASIPEKKP